ncbi:MAG: 50S ribosomal protein L3 [archaeon]
MPKTHKPRAGSLQYWPRKKAKKQTARVRAWSLNTNSDILGFPGYKVGMTHLHALISNPGVKQKEPYFTPITIIECPPLKPFSLRFYKKNPNSLSLVSEILAKNLDKKLGRKIKFPKKFKETMPEQFDELRLLAYTQPILTSLNKKKPEIVEIKLSNNLEHAKSLLEKDIHIQDVFKENQYVDIHSVTKGKGFQGPVKRFGIALKGHKSEKGRRAPGSLGNWMAKTWRVAHAGQTGYHLRTEHNKQIIKISNKPEEINEKSGFHNYGFIKNPYILIKGSIPGPKKRLITLTYPLRNKKAFNFNVTSIKNVGL